MDEIRKSTRDGAWAALFLAPQVIGLIVFSIGPIIAAIVLSLFQWDAIGTPLFIGFQNFVDIFSGGSDFWIALKNTLYYSVLTIPVAIILALVLAVLLNNVKGKMIYRTIYFMPQVTSSVAVCMIWLWMYNGDFGLINQLLSYVGIKGPQWLTDTRWVMPAIAILSIWWGLGYNMTIFLAGLQSIPRSYYEAATIDGANAMQQFRHITLPLISPTTFFLTIMAVISSFQVFDQAYIMTGGGPAKASTTLVYLVWNTAFQEFYMGRASAIALMLFVMILIVTLIQFKFSDRWVNYEI
jgi:multiple sugar transport system permease protein